MEGLPTLFWVNMKTFSQGHYTEDDMTVVQEDGVKTSSCWQNLSTPYALSTWQRQKGGAFVELSQDQVLSGTVGALAKRPRAIWRSCEGEISAVMETSGY